VTLFCEFAYLDMKGTNAVAADEFTIDNFIGT